MAPSWREAHAKMNNGYSASVFAAIRCTYLRLHTVPVMGHRGNELLLKGDSSVIYPRK